MSTSLLYHGFGVRGYNHVCSEYRGGGVILHIQQDLDTLRCPVCGMPNPIRRGEVVRTFRALPIGGKPVRLVLPVQRVQCRSCGAVRQVKLGFADERRHYCRAFERYVLELSRRMTILDVARHLQVSWDTIKDIQKRYLLRKFAKPKLKHLKRLAVDEIAVAKGQRYLTIVLDLDSGAVVFVGTGKGAEALDQFWKRLKSCSARIEAVAMDLSAAYQLAVRTNLPAATIVFDHFHLIKLFNEKLSDLRRDLQREAEGPLHKQVLKGTRWLLLKNPQNLDQSRNERKRLEEALALNKPLATAYYMKEDLRQLWDQVDKAAAEHFLDDWIGRAQSSGIRMLQQFAVTLASYRHGILAWYDYPISTAPLEGTNNKIKVLKRMAYGFRDHEFFALKIYGIHEAKYALVG